MLDADREAVEIAQAWNLHPTTVARWKKESVEKGAGRAPVELDLLEAEKESDRMKMSWSTEV